LAVANPRVRSEMSGSEEKIDGFDYHIEGPPLPVRLYNPGDIEGARMPFIRFQQYLIGQSSRMKLT
jgi:hypothetical protein